MRLVAFGDLHSHNYQQYATKLTNGRNSRLQDCLNVVAQITNFCKAGNVDICLCLGDVFDNRRLLEIDVLSATYSAFLALAKSVKTLVILCGNHDQHNRIGGVHSLEQFKQIAVVVDQPLVERFSSAGESIVLAAHPHTVDAKAFRMFIKTLRKGDLFAFHQGLREATVGPSDFRVKTELSVEDLPYERFKFCVGGDYHKAQAVKANVFYCGSPLQLSFGERLDKKGFWSVDSKNWNWQFHESNAPKFFRFHSQEEFSSSMQEGLCNPAKDFIHVFCKSAAEQSSLKNSYPKLVTSEAPTEVVVKTRSSSESFIDDKELLSSYNKLTKTDEADILLSLGLELLKEAN